MTDSETKNIISKALEFVDFYRGIVLDGVQIEVGDSPCWESLRSRILKAFGDRGLAGKIKNLDQGGSPQ